MKVSDSREMDCQNWNRRAMLSWQKPSFLQPPPQQSEGISLPKAFLPNAEKPGKSLFFKPTWCLTTPHPPPHPALSFITPVFFARFFPMFSPPFSFCHWLGSHDWDILGSLSLLQELWKRMYDLCARKRIRFCLATKITKRLNRVEF